MTFIKQFANNPSNVISIFELRKLKQEDYDLIEIKHWYYLVASQLMVFFINHTAVFCFIVDKPNL